MNSFGKTEKWRKKLIKLFEILCEAFAQLSEVCIVSLFNDVCPHDSTLLLEEIIDSRAIQNRLIHGDDVDVKCRMRFANAITQFVFERFHRTENDRETMFYSEELNCFMKRSSYMGRMVCDMATRLKRHTDKILVDVALLITLETFQFIHTRPMFNMITGNIIENSINKNIPIEYLLEVWQLWKAIEFPEIYLEWIVYMYLALTIAQEHAITCVYGQTSCKCIVKTFYVDLAGIIVRSLDCGVFLHSAECFRIFMEFSASNPNETNAEEFSKQIFAKISSMIEKMNDMKVAILFLFLDNHCKEMQKVPEACCFFNKLADKMCTINKRVHIRDQDLYTYMHKMSYKLVLISDEWQDIDLMIETLEKFSTSLESFDQQMLGHLGLAYLVKGKQLVKEGNDTEAEEWFTKAERTFSRAKDVPESRVYGAGIFQLMQGNIFF